MTEVMLNKTCGPLKAINSGLEFETVVSTAVHQGDPDFTVALWGLVVFFMETCHTNRWT